MSRPILYTFLSVLGIIALVMTSCTAEPATGVTGAVAARDATITYLQEYDTENAPATDTEWQETDVTPADTVGGVTKEFTSDAWTITVSYPVVLPENTVYQVKALSTESGLYWERNVAYDGSVRETEPLDQISEEESRELAEEFVKNSPTFAFDGIEETLVLTETLTARCPYCWTFVFDFDSSQAGYGDRTGQMLAQVITHHQAVVTVEQMQVTTAVMDGKWNMLTQAVQDESTDNGEILSVAELLANPVYDTEVTIYGEVNSLGILLCSCFMLISDNAIIEVWYDSMVDNNEIERPAVSIEGLHSGNNIIITGELKGEGGTHYAKGDFWANVIEIQQQ